jgi:Ca-activated chloride channel family protein
MAGDSIDQAKIASTCILESLRPQDYFNIVAFGNKHRPLFRRMKPADRDNLDDAIDFVASLQADMGGTGLDNALSSALEFSCKHISTLDIILITDGEVWNIDETVQIAVKGSRRIFSIGVGSSPAESLLKTLSAKTGGACEFVFPGESMTEKILRHVRRIYSLRIKTIDTLWPFRPERTFPESIQGIFVGDTVHLFGWFISRPETGEVSIALTLDDGQTMQISAGDMTKTSVCKTPGLIARMTAALQLLDMTDSEAASEIAVKYQLISRYTHCLAIAVQAEGDKAQTLPRLQSVKQMMAAGWGGSGRINTASYRRAISMNISAPSPCILPEDIDYSEPYFSRKTPIRERNFEYRENHDIPKLKDIPIDPTIEDFVAYLNHYDLQEEINLPTILNNLPLPIQEVIYDHYIQLSDRDISEDDILTIFLMILLKSDYGKNLNLNMSRTIKKRFKMAKLSKEIVEQMSGKITQILSLA